MQGLIGTSLSAQGINLVLVFDGNSLTEGINNAGINQYYPSIVNNFFTGKVASKEFYSYGVGGQTINAMLSDRTTQIYPKAKAGKTNILIAWEDANGILRDGSTAALNLSRFNTYFTGATGFQYKIIITGYYPRKSADGTYTYVALNTNPAPLYVQKEFFDQVKTATTPTWTHHIDLRDAPIIGGYVQGETLDPNYFADYLHLQASGYEIIAAIVIAKISEIIGI